MYVVEILTGEILFDLMALRVNYFFFNQKSKKNKKYYQNEKLWQEILYHSACLMNSYTNEIGYQFEGQELSYKVLVYLIIVC